MREEHQKRGEGPSTINQFIVTPAFLQEEDVYEDNKYERVVISSPDNMPIKMSASVSSFDQVEHLCKLINTQA